MEKVAAETSVKGGESKTLEETNNPTLKKGTVGLLEDSTL